jgi:hypothetical protein
VVLLRLQKHLQRRKSDVAGADEDQSHARNR